GGTIRWTGGSSFGSTAGRGFPIPSANARESGRSSPRTTAGPPQARPGSSTQRRSPTRRARRPRRKPARRATVAATHPAPAHDRAGATPSRENVGPASGRSGPGARGPPPTRGPVGPGRDDRPRARRGVRPTLAVRVVPVQRRVRPAARPGPVRVRRLRVPRLGATALSLADQPTPGIPARVPRDLQGGHLSGRVLVLLGARTVPDRVPDRLPVLPAQAATRPGGVRPALANKEVRPLPVRVRHGGPGRPGHPAGSPLRGPAD